ncbi:hypothetical protein BAE44_0006999 [Dichanthelium oligosanthes]|uniref:DUF6598 domain-containing protein n=1 Tax=Dichanthelium oligosanthes TaxID=888268 RepID=A0A1E5W3I9_9POAL|nr:hypothetical protein BAE44_0006999 [Dichanthelium oligosanthes]
MEAVDLETKRAGDNQLHDLEKAAGDEVVSGGDAKRPRKGNDGYHAMELDDEDEEEVGPHECFEMYRKEWILMYGKNDAASFYKPTGLRPMRHTDGPLLPSFAIHMDAMEVFFVKVARLTGGLQWPLDVYGDVADSLLELTGPSRAVVLLDEPIFEIDLKVKCEGSSSSSEDKVLCLDYFGYNNIAYHGTSSYAITEEVSSESCAMEFRFTHLKRCVEATITAHITSESGSFSARFTARTTSIGEDVVLLDSQGREVAVAEDGEVMLQRHVVVVEEQGELVLGMEAMLLGGDAAESTGVSQKLSYYARSALRSIAYFEIGSIRIKMLVAWSLLH